MISTPDRHKTIELIDKARPDARLEAACRVIDITARTYQRWTRDDDIRQDKRPAAERPAPANKLSCEERQRVLDICHEPEHASLPPGQIVPRLADQGIYIASESSFYRILHEADEQHHRGRAQKPRKNNQPKGFCATGADQVWTWDITYLPTLIRGMFFYLYMIVDVYSRKIVGWEIHDRESSGYAADLVQNAVWAEGCISNPPILHSDNGAPQKGFTLKAKLESLGIQASYSRPSVSNDNPYSEALFRTCKYRPDYPVNGFETIDTSRQWAMHFVSWYNTIHLHSAIRYIAPDKRHAGEDGPILEKRRAVYEAARKEHPERWRGRIRNWSPITEVWLNEPKMPKPVIPEFLIMGENQNSGCCLESHVQQAASFA